VKSILQFVASIVVVLLISGCNVSRSSHVVVGNRRPPINPENVKIYLHPPARYEEIALVSSDSRNAFASAQSLMDSAIQRLKSEAAKLGANGVLLTGAGDQYGGSVGFATGNATAYGTPTGAMAFGTATAVSAPIVNKAAAGMAIFVIQE
jgi:hypothetical protein